MSLIADALKAAQQERSDRSGGLDGARKRQAAVTALRTSAEFTPRSARAGAGLTPALWASLGVFALAMAGAVYFVLRVPPAPDEALAPASPSGLESQPVGERPETQLEYIDLGTLPVDGTAGPVYVEYDELGNPPGDFADDFGSGPLGEADLPAPVEDEAPAPGTMAARAAAVIAAAQELLADEEVAEAPRSAASAGAREASPPVTAEPAPPGRFEIRVGAPSSSSVPSFGLAVAAQRRGDYRTAVQQYLAVLERDAGNVEAMNNLGASYQALGDFPRARQAFERAISAQPSYAAAWSNLGLVLGSMGIEQEALAALTEAVRLEPGNSGTRVNLALAYERMGRMPDARRVLEDVVRADPRHPEAHYALGRLLEQAGDRVGAAEHYRAFLTFGATRFPQLDTPVRERIRLLEAGNGR